MNGLQYLMGEIQERRFLLHDFIERIQEPEEFMLFPEAVPHFVKDGQLTFRANRDTLYKGLTVAEFNKRYLKEFLNFDTWNSIMVPLTSANPAPENYRIEEFLQYEYGEGYRLANLIFGLETPALPQKFIMLIQDTALHKPMIRYIKNGREWTYPENFEVGDKELEKLLMASHPYARWQADKKKARTRADPRSDFSNPEGYYRREGERRYTVPTIIINEETSRDRIWPQVIVHGWGYGYFQTLEDEKQAFKELKHYWFPGHTWTDEFHADDIDEIMSDLMQHLRKHPVVPYEAKTAGAYFSRLIKGYIKKKNKGVLKEAGGTLERNDGLRERISRYPPGSVMSVAMETGIPSWTLYRLIRNRKLEYTKNDEGFLFLDDQAIDKIAESAQDKALRQAIIKSAFEEGKSAEAIKKWLQRHRNLSREHLLTETALWLDIQKEYLMSFLLNGA